MTSGAQNVPVNSGTVLVVHEGGRLKTGGPPDPKDLIGGPFASNPFPGVKGIITVLAFDDCGGIVCRQVPAHVWQSGFAQGAPGKERDDAGYEPNTSRGKPGKGIHWMTVRV